VSRTFFSAADCGEWRVTTDLVLEEAGSFTILESWSSYGGAGPGGTAHGRWVQEGDTLVLSVWTSTIEVFPKGAELTCRTEGDHLIVGGQRFLRVP
jgi:hypothetical protein